VKKVLAIVLAITAILVLAAPALADYPTNVHVGASATGNPPYIKVLTMTPDQTEEEPELIKFCPETARPIEGTGVFDPIASLSPAHDGWRLMNIYVEIAPGYNTVDQISMVRIDIDYPSNSELCAAGYPEFTDPTIFGDRGDQSKINIIATKDTTWSASAVYGFDEMNTYPDGTLGVPPASAVRVLLNAEPSDWVDVNANGMQDAGEPNWDTFLEDYGTPRIVYGNDLYGNPVTIGDAQYEYNANEAVVLEIQAWIWFHQPGVQYTVNATAYVGNDVSQEVTNYFTLEKMVSLYVPFDCVAYPNVVAGGTSVALGDFDLATAALTVWNNGNASGQLTVNSTRMVLDGNPDWADQPGKYINHFNAELYYRSLLTTKPNIQVGYITYTADEGAVVICNDGSGINGSKGPTGPVLLQACRPGKLELSVDPPATPTLVTGDYTGSICLGIEEYQGDQLVAP